MPLSQRTIFSQTMMMIRMTRTLTIAPVTTRCWYILERIICQKNLSVKFYWLNAKSVTAENKTYRLTIFFSVPEARSIATSARCS